MRSTRHGPVMPENTTLGGAAPQSLVGFEKSVFTTGGGWTISTTGSTIC